jgi:protein TonB
MIASSSRHSSSRPPPSSQRGQLAAASTRPAPPLGVVVSAHDPMERILDLGKTDQVSKGMVASTAIQALFLLVMALVGNWGLAHWTHQIQTEILSQLRSDYEIEITKDETPPPPPPPEEEQKPEPKEVVMRQPLPANSPPPPPPAAAAAPILTAPADPNQIEDMTNTIVTGNGPGSGGVTMNEGSSQGPGRGTGGAPQGTPTGSATTAPPAPPVSTVDHSKIASAVNGDWRCPFPPAADIAGVDDASAVVDVIIKPDGTPASARVVSDPGNGFGAAAVSCAMRERYHAALDRDGNPIQQSKRINVKFSR